MDKGSLFGIILSFVAILGGQILEGGHVGSILQATAFLIVAGGTFGAVILQTPIPVFMNGLRMTRWIFFPPHSDPERMIEQVGHWSHVARKEGLLALEAQIADIEDSFVSKGLQMLVDGAEPEKLRETLEVELGTFEEHMKHSAKIWEAAGGYAPTIGILGAVMGLIHVMENLADPSKLGGGIAVAFVATIYGVGLANLFFLPMLKKLMFHIEHLTAMRLMFIDGLIGIANGDSAGIIKTRMQGYVTE